MENSVPAMWKEDKELGYVYVCSVCHRAVYSNRRCYCGAKIDMSLPKDHYDGKVKWENYAAINN